LKDRKKFFKVAEEHTKKHSEKRPADWWTIIPQSLLRHFKFLFLICLSLALFFRF
jgi:hypothetical protein